MHFFTVHKVYKIYNLIPIYLIAFYRKFINYIGKNKIEKFFSLLIYNLRSYVTNSYSFAYITIFVSVKNNKLLANKYISKLQTKLFTLILILNDKNFPDIINLYAFNKLNLLYKSEVILYRILIFWLSYFISNII